MEVLCKMVLVIFTKSSLWGLVTSQENRDHVIDIDIDTFISGTFQRTSVHKFIAPMDDSFLFFHFCCFNVVVPVERAKNVEYFNTVPTQIFEISANYFVKNVAKYCFFFLEKYREILYHFFEIGNLFTQLKL